MSDFIEIHWTTGSLDEARRVARYLVQERYVASAQIIPWIESTFMWDNKLDTTQESKVILKTVRPLFPEIKKIILENAAYELPEITVLPIEDGHLEYLDWVRDSTSLQRTQN